MSDPGISERTKVSGELKGMIGLIIAILGGGIAAGVATTQLIQRVSSLEQRVAQLPTKEDLLRATTRQQASYVLCPGRKSDSWVKCKVVQQGENEP